jgi:hypothetical protein
MTAGDIYTVAGDGTAGYAGDGAAATSAKLNHDNNVGVDGSGDLLIADSGNGAVRLVAASTCSSTCAFGLPSTTAGDIYTVAGTGANALNTVPRNGESATATTLNNPAGVAVDPGGDLLITDTQDHQVQLVAGSDCSSSCAYGLSSMTEGDMYTVAGSGADGFSGAGGLAIAAEFNWPYHIAVDRAGDLLFPDYYNSVVWMVAASNCSSECPYGLSSMTANHVYIVAGTGTSGYSGDGGAATNAKLNGPTGIALDSGGNMVIADLNNQRVRTVTTWVSPGVSVSAPSAGTAGSTISASSVSSTLSGGSSPMGTITFTVFGPQSSPPSSCTSGGTTVGTATVSGNGAYNPSSGLTPSAAGDYWWYASYSGDANNHPESSSCGPGMAGTVVAAPTSTGSTGATSSAPPSNAFTITSDTAGSNGTITLGVDLPGPGTVDVLGTHEDVTGHIASVLEPGHNRFAWGRLSATTMTAGTIKLTLKADRNGKKLLARHRHHGWALHVTVWVTYTPTGGNPVSKEIIVRALKAKQH